MHHPCRSIRVSFLILFAVVSLMPALPVCAGHARKSYSKAVIERKHLRERQEGGEPKREPAASLLAGLDGHLLELYDDIALVEINVRDKDELKHVHRRRARIGPAAIESLPYVQWTSQMHRYSSRPLR